MRGGRESREISAGNEGPPARSYAVRVNSQSGKGGVAYPMRAEHDLVLPRLLQIEFTRMVQREVEETGEEITAERLIKLFRSEYNSSKVRVVTHEVSADDTRHVSLVRASLQDLDRATLPISGSGNGTIAAFTEGIEQALGLKIRVRDYSQQTLSDGTDAKAMSYVKLSIGDRLQRERNRSRADRGHSDGSYPARRADCGSLAQESGRSPRSWRRWAALPRLGPAAASVAVWPSTATP
jgi:hypothetical protein